MTYMYIYYHADPRKKEQYMRRSYISVDRLDKIPRDMIIDRFAYDKPLEPYTRMLPRAARRGPRMAHPISTRARHHLSQDLLFGQLKVCCQHHEHVGRLYCQYRGLVAEGDKGYDADTETAAALPSPTLPKVLPKRRTQQRRKRLRWQLVHSHF